MIIPAVMKIAKSDHINYGHVTRIDIENPIEDVNITPSLKLIETTK